MTPIPGQTVSHYTILDHVGSGGMGTVYKARDLKLNRTVALKFLPPALTGDLDSKQRMVHEARALSALQHKNICGVHEIDETDDAVLFISMEWLEGETLTSKIASGPLPFPVLTSIASQVAQGLARAHDAGIVHRDIKPANIIVTDDGTVKILDFGLAKMNGLGLATRAGTTVGTAAYMSPEQAGGRPVDHRTDIWSLGVVLYECLTGRRPFQADYEQAIMYGILNEAPQVISTLRRDVPAPWEAIISRCLEKSPSARYPDARSLADALLRLDTPPSVAPVNAAKSIAVLPFADISPDRDNRYFSDGLTEEIIAKLSKLRGVKAVSSTSVMHYDRTGKSMKQIAAELGVQFVLEGSVRKHGSALRITTQLVDAGQDVSLWGETYDGTMEQIFDIQENVAARIVKALRVRLTPDEKRNLKRRATHDTDAYQLYLKGRFFWSKRSAEGLRTAIRFFEQAIEKDPRYALAWAGLADAYNLFGEYGGVSRKETLPTARAAVEKALEFDDQLAEAHTSLASLLMFDGWNWKDAEEHFRIALRLNPGYATAHHWHAEWLAYQGRLDEALAEMSRAIELEPLSHAILKDKGMFLYYARDYSGAIEHARRTFELDPSFGSTHRLLSLAYQGKGMYAEAIAENEQWRKLTGHDLEASVALAQCRAAAGEREEALSILRELAPEKLAAGNAIRGIALVYAALGDIDEAFQWLDKAYALRVESLVSVKIDPKLDRLRGDPRFSVFLRKMGLET